MRAAIAEKEAQVAAWVEKAKELEADLARKGVEAESKETGLRNDLRLQRQSSVKLEGEVSFWKGTHESQGYCNTTLIREDSLHFVNHAIEGATRGLDRGHKALTSGLGSQLELVQQTSSDVMVFLQTELLPNIERVIGEGYDKCQDLYDQHLATAVNEHVLPFYNQNALPVYQQNVLPVYQQHLSPVVRTIEGEAAVAMQKSREGINIARTTAATVVKESADNFMGVLEAKEMDTKLPGWLYGFIDRCSADGEWAVDTLTRGMLVLLLILCRGLIYRLIGAVFSLVWFFCPLRLFVGGGRQTTVAENGAKKRADVAQSVKANKKKGKVKVY